MFAPTMQCLEDAESIRSLFYLQNNFSIMIIDSVREASIIWNFDDHSG